MSSKLQLDAEISPSVQISSKAQIPLGPSRHVSTRSTYRDERVVRVEPCCSNMADDEQTTNLVVFMLLH